MSEDTRYVAVRWFVPKVGPVIAVYDRQSAGDMATWSQNDELKYVSQVLGMAADPSELPAPTGWGDE
jgi:molybdopterin-guanine dinucleotide biosynthesis protein A